MPCLWQWGNTAAAVICAGLESETVQVPSNSWSHSVSNTHSWTNHPAAQGENMEKPDQDPGRTMQLTQEPFSNFPALQHLPELTDSLWSTVLCAPPCTRACQDNLQEHRVGAGRKEPTVWGGGEEEAGCGGVFVVWCFFCWGAAVSSCFIPDMAGCWQDDLVARETAGKVHRAAAHIQAPGMPAISKAALPQQGCHQPPHARRWWTGAEPTERQASAPTRLGLGANPGLWATERALCKGCDVQTALTQQGGVSTVPNGCS